jgi:hypothetical protein
MKQPSDVCRKKFPQKVRRAMRFATHTDPSVQLLDFYESNLKWRAGD